MVMSAAKMAHRLVEAAAKQTARRHNGGWGAVEAFGPLTMIPGPSFEDYRLFTRALRSHSA